MFGTYKMSLHRVRDTVKIKEGTESITLHVDQDPLKFVGRLNTVKKALEQINDDTSVEEVTRIAEMFASAIFGDEQSHKLLEFYGDPASVIALCGNYFKERLGKLITKAQKQL